MNNNYTSINIEPPPPPYTQEFWDKDAIFLLKQGIKRKNVKWYLLRTKQYIAVYPDKNVRTYTQCQVKEYLENRPPNQVKKLAIHSYQFSKSSPATRENSPILRVTKIPCCASAVAAIKTSCGPIGVPCFSSVARTVAAHLASAS